jgi:hypothetical protein
MESCHILFIIDNAKQKDTEKLKTLETSLAYLICCKYFSKFYYIFAIDKF